MAVHFVPRTIFCIKNGLVLPNYHDLHVHIHRLETGILEDVLEEILGKEIVDESDQVADLRELARQRRQKTLGGGQNGG